VGVYCRSLLYTTLVQQYTGESPPPGKRVVDQHNVCIKLLTLANDNTLKSQHSTVNTKIDILTQGQADVCVDWTTWEPIIMKFKLVMIQIYTYSHLPTIVASAEIHECV
jgi:hypothetical protein